MILAKVLNTKKLLLLILLVLIVKLLFSKIIYVDKNNGGGTGTSWNNAYTELYSALNAASAGDTIWVASGIYKPENTAGRYSTFQVVPYHIFGGFAGNETSISQRNISSNPTILSGNIGAETSKTDNCYHVVYAAAYPNTLTTLDGLIVQEGYADLFVSTSSNTDDGAGIYSVMNAQYNEYLEIRNCIIRDNYASGLGAGINEEGGFLTISNTKFIHNTSGDEGGGIRNSGKLLIQDCIFQENYGSHYSVKGAGICTNNDTEILNTRFYGNRIADTSTSWNGGGSAAISVNSGIFKIYNSVFRDNYSNGHGSAIYFEGVGNSAPLVVNCTFLNNYSFIKGSVIGKNLFQSPVHLFNNIIWNEAGDDSTFYEYFHTGYFSLSHCSTFEPDTGVNVVTIQPQFRNLNGADNLPATVDDNFQLVFGSPLINGGKSDTAGLGLPNFDLEYNQRISSDTVDIGAMEQCSDASSSETVTVCNGDAYTFPDGYTKAILSSGTIHISSFASSNFCDSIIITTVNTELVNVSVDQFGTRLTALADSSTFQWLDCDNNYAPISGETSAVYNGGGQHRYAVEVTNSNGCKDTSDCYLTSPTGLDKSQDLLVLNIYPNPTYEYLNVEFGEVNELEYRVYNNLGEEMISGVLKENSAIDVSKLSPGIYMLRIEISDKSSFHQFIKN